LTRRVPHGGGSSSRYNPLAIMAVIAFLLVVAAAGLAGFAVLRGLGLDDLEAWVGGRLAGLVLVALPAWWLGVLGSASWRTLGSAWYVTAAVIGAVVMWRQRARWRELATAEAIILAGFLLVLFIRLDHPQIAGQEKPMDMGIFASLLRARSFPPPDMWLAGEALPYYYWGALLWTIPITISPLPLEVAYNLVVGVIGGVAFAMLWVLGRRLASGSHAAGLMAGFFGIFAGTPDGLRQLLGGVDLRHLNVWQSSRQHEDVITEFPLFTAWLGDLHPHLLSLPVACLAMLVAWQAGRDGPRATHGIALAALFGVAWAANPWAMPPTFAVIALLLLTADGRWHWPNAEGRRRWLTIAAVGVGGWLFTAPFHLSFTPFFQGVRPVFAWTAPMTLLLYGGCLLLPTSAAVIVLLRERVGDDAQRRALLLAAAAFVMVAAVASHRPTLVVLAAGLVVLVLRTVVPGEHSERPAIALAALGVFLFLVPEVLYVVDGYGDRLHRMNTVFKSYIQAWIVLSAALPALVILGARARVVRIALVVAIVVPALPHLMWAVANQFSGRPLGLDGMAWMAPGDRAIVNYLRLQPPGTSLIEAVGGAYSEYARLSANSGVPTLIGWENHEMVWRGGALNSETSRRRGVVEEVYRCGAPGRVRRLVLGEGIDLVAIGSLERRDFPADSLAAVMEAGSIELDRDGGVLVRFRATDVGPVDTEYAPQ
jgi:YYY domain-containing protein